MSSSVRTAVQHLESAVGALYEFEQIVGRRAPRFEFESDAWAPIPVSDIVEALQSLDGSARKGEAGEFFDEALASLAAYLDATRSDEREVDLDFEEDDRTVTTASLIAGLAALLNTEREALRFES